MDRVSRATRGQPAGVYSGLQLKIKLVTACGCGNVAFRNRIDDQTCARGPARVPALLLLPRRRRAVGVVVPEHLLEHLVVELLELDHVPAAGRRLLLLPSRRGITT